MVFDYILEVCDGVKPELRQCLTCPNKYYTVKGANSAQCASCFNDLAVRLKKRGPFD